MRTTNGLRGFSVDLSEGYMEFSIEMFIASLFLGVILGFVYAFITFCVKYFKINKYAVLFIDIFFVQLACIVSFLLSLAVSFGRPNLRQFLAEIIGFSIVSYVCFGAKNKKLKDKKWKGINKNE